MPSSPPPLSALARQALEEDPERFQCALFAPRPRREAVMVLLAVNASVARIAPSVTEPVLGQMRLRWWLDTVASLGQGERAPSGHPGAEALHELACQGVLDPTALAPMIEARAADLEPSPFPTQDALGTYARATAGTLSDLSVRVLGGAREAPPEVARVAARVGTAWGLLGLLRATRALAAEGRCVLPVDDLARAGVAPTDLSQPPALRALAPVCRALVERIQDTLAQARAEAHHVPTPVAAPLLLTALADPFVRRLRSTGFDLADPALAARPARPARLAAAALGQRWRSRHASLSPANGQQNQGLP
ncbi:squalene/phytoene synthase family protein [Pararhodospirillum oryzae]|uniref:Phytoene synthase n=1 Tax=Pararhodospirillum oryzae TaxID=478448 RepID=A0A512HBB7_9PROT|nr:squalene/phytoene synthase family protein [Pararhodospirillum oryzae]GEO82747.1 hypothetical protein ROR02_28780 [Pararhodospirillum oryzae]